MFRKTLGCFVLAICLRTKQIVLWKSFCVSIDLRLNLVQETERVMAVLGIHTGERNPTVDSSFYSFQIQCWEHWQKKSGLLSATDLFLRSGPRIFSWDHIRDFSIKLISWNKKYIIFQSPNPKHEQWNTSAKYSNVDQDIYSINKNASGYVSEKAQSVCNPSINHCTGHILDSSQKCSASLCVAVPLIWNGSRNDEVVKVSVLASFH